MPRRSKRLLRRAGDERLVEQVRAGNEAAFEVVFERHGKGILAFCRHMLGSQEEAEDAVQQTFAAAHRDLLRSGERELRLTAWLYTIARNRCLSMLRARREEVELSREPATTGLADQVEHRAELRELLDDIGRLPAEQREALLLAEVADLSHAEIGDVLDCGAARVKGLVFRARSSLIERREARDTPCEEIREQLAVLTGGSLRRSNIRHHLAVCEGCSRYRQQVKLQRQLLAAALPVVPPVWLKAHVLGAAGGGGAAGGSAVLAKAAALTVLAGTGGVATQAVLEHHQPPRHRPPPIERSAPPAQQRAPLATAPQARHRSSPRPLSRARSSGPTPHASTSRPSGESRRPHRDHATATPVAPRAQATPVASPKQKAPAKPHHTDADDRGEHGREDQQLQHPEHPAHPAHPEHPAHPVHPPKPPKLGEKGDDARAD
jgi:RNA polymerase sigma factor (sigma-70 family)